MPQQNMTTLTWKSFLRQLSLSLDYNLHLHHLLFNLVVQKRWDLNLRRHAKSDVEGIQRMLEQNQAQEV
jgi:hypothetical protein